MQNIIIAGYVASYPLTRTKGENAITMIHVEVTDPRKPEAPPTSYRVKCWNSLGTVVSQKAQIGAFVVVTADHLQVKPYINKDGHPACEIDLWATNVDYNSTD